ncbi:hypothetical protein BH10PSE10_BH10PSE10_07030 [soil metagenome]
MNASENSWTTDTEDYDTKQPERPNKNFESRELGKPMKTVIGIGLLVVVALALSRMHPVPHDVPDVPSWTTGQAAGADVR